MRTIDVFGRVSSDTISVTKASILLNLANQTICLGNNVSISPQTASTNYQYLWNTNQTTPSITVSTAGTYFVLMTDTFGCFATSNSINVTIDTFSKTVQLGNDTNICSGNQIALISPSTTNWPNYTFQWSSGQNSPSIAVTTTGSYVVSVTNNIGCVGQDTINVSVLGSAPFVDFTSDTLCVGEMYIPSNLTVSLDTSTVSNYLWDFGDGTLSTQNNPSHLYLGPGVYTVSLGATNTTGCSGFATRIVRMNARPTASYTSANGCILNPINFTDQSTTPVGTNINQWTWQFGDGTNSTIQNPTHTYSTGAIFNPQLTITNTDGCSDTAATTITILSSAPSPGTPILHQPSDNSQVGNTFVNFLWSAAANAQQYVLQISYNPQFSPFLIDTNTSATSLNLLLSGTQPFYWRVKSTNICGDSSFSLTYQFTIVTPDNLPNLALWLKADAGVTLNSGAVTQWNDFSANNLHASQSNAANRPTLTAPVSLLNNLPTIRFDGSNDFLSGTPIPNYNDSSLTIFILANGLSQSAATTGLLTANGSGNGFWIIRRSTSNKYGTITNSTLFTSTSSGPMPQAGFNYKLFGYQKNFGVSIQLLVNGVADGGSATANSIGPFTNANYQIGGATSSFYNGNFAEVIVYTRLLSVTERTQVQNYIYNKYAPPVNLGPDIVQNYSLCPVNLNAGNRFVNYLWSTGDTTSSISAATSGNYWVRTIDVFGRVSSDTISINLAYQGKLNSLDTIICNYNNITLSPIISSSPYSILWSDSSSASTLTTNLAGDYFCLLTDTNGCHRYSDTISLSVDSFSLAQVLPNDTAVCNGNLLGIYSGSNIISTITWNTGATSINIPIVSAGNYFVQATNSNNCINNDTTQVSIKWIAPIVDFNTTGKCLGDATILTDISQTTAPDEIETWSWDFGDGGQSQNQNPNYTYSLPGSYSVSLYAVTDSGCSGLVTKIINISPSPIASFYSSPAIICANTTASIFNTSNILFGDSINTVKWTLNQTDVLNSYNTNYAFPSSGFIPITLEVTTSNGCSDTTQKTIEVFAPFDVDFEFENICLGDTVSFSDVTNSFSIINRQWNFGDGSFFVSEKNPKHKFNVADTYLVTLQAENAIGCIDTTSKSVVIVEKPKADFTNLIGCEDAPYAPLDNSTSAEAITNRLWLINSSFYNSTTPQFTYSDTGIYPIQLTVKTQSGCVDSITKNISIKPRPTAAFGFTPLYGEAPVEITGINQSTGASTYEWSFGDGNFSADENPKHTYTQNGTYTIQLKAISAFGCDDSISLSYLVIPTDLDIAITEITTNQVVLPDGNIAVSITAKVSNLGTRQITNYTLYANVGSGGVITETWNGLLSSGQTMLYTFTAKFILSNEKAETYVCVKATDVNNGEAEIALFNNQQCTPLTEMWQIAGPTPNPSSGASSVGIILPKAGKVTVSIIDLMGRIVWPAQELNLPAGRTDYALPIQQLLGAEYFIQLTYNDEKTVRKLFVRK